MIFKTVDYKTRDALDKAVINAVGTNTDIKEKASYKIVGSVEDLKRLHISEDVNIYGVTVEIE